MTIEALANGNGHAPPTEVAVEVRLAAMAQELRDLLEEQELKITELTAELGEARAKRDHIRKAISHLTGETQSGRPAPAAEPKPKRDKHDWQISDAKVAEIWALIHARTDSFTAATIANETPGLSPQTAKKGMEILRDRDLLRRMGKKARGGGTLFKVMPNAAELDAMGRAPQQTELPDAA